MKNSINGHPFLAHDGSSNETFYICFSTKSGFTLAYLSRFIWKTIEMEQGTYVWHFSRVLDTCPLLLLKISYSKTALLKVKKVCSLFHPDYADYYYPWTVILVSRDGLSDLYRLLCNIFMAGINIDWLYLQCRLVCEPDHLV